MNTHTQAWGDVVRSLSQREFVKRHPGFFLLSTSDPAELSTLFQTMVVAKDDKSPNRASRSAGRRAFEVRWIHKAEGSTEEPDHVTVGRASQCDITFRHPSVSKLHARFKVEKNKLWIIDAGSRNGTSVNGQQITGDKPHDLVQRDRVQFGSVSCMVLDSAALHECLSLGI